mmetsp:Transcript_12195/g.13481  ORF Transcript_12195/g.13481 Transcript_12195/m.13481 type:complete len:105 (+) Transcript_12195:787-1101(+)
MLALNVFSSEKRKRPTNAYSTYRSLSRWVKMLDTRKKGRAWRFTVRANEKARWAAVTKEVRNMLAIERLVEWEWTCNGFKETMALKSRTFAICIDAVAWACTLQ